MKLVVLGVLLAILSWVASAHEMRPSIASLSVDSQGVLKLELVTNMEAWLANVDPSLSDTNDSPNAAITIAFGPSMQPSWRSLFETRREISVESLRSSQVISRLQ